MKHIPLGAAIVLAFTSFAFAGDTPSTPGATVYIVNLKDGDTVQSPVTVVFGLGGMGVTPAGVEKEGTGHHHMFLNRVPFGDRAEDADLIANGIPADENHIHYGGGQTQATYDLEPGEYTMQLVLGDQFHVPHDPPVVSDVITVTVTE